MTKTRNKEVVSRIMSSLEQRTKLDSEIVKLSLELKTKRSSHKAIDTKITQLLSIIDIK